MPIAHVSGTVWALHSFYPGAVGIIVRDFRAGRDSYHARAGERHAPISGARSIAHGRQYASAAWG